MREERNNEKVRPSIKALLEHLSEYPDQWKIDIRSGWLQVTHPDVKNLCLGLKGNVVKLKGSHKMGYQAAPFTLSNEEKELIGKALKSLHRVKEENRKKRIRDTENEFLNESVRSLVFGE